MTSNAFVLKSIELKNWKAFSDLSLELSPEGLTGIVGKNGSGKSSFVDAILWCLYGTRPKGVTNGALRRRKSDPKTDETLVKITFTHAGQTVEVSRSMKGKNNTVTAKVFLDGADMTGDTGFSAESWILNRLGMDSDGFKMAIVVPQKELDGLVDAIPSVRREKIERLAGVEEMNVAVGNSSEKENELSRELKVMPGSEEEIERAEEHLEDISEELETVEGTLSHAAMLESEAAEEMSKISEETRDLKESYTVVSSLTRELEGLKNSRNLTQQKIDSTQASIAEASKEVSDIDISAHASLQEEYRVLNRKVNETNSAFSEHQSKNSSKALEFERSNKELQGFIENLDSLSKTLGKLKDQHEAIEAPESAENRMNEANATGARLQSEIGSLRARVGDLTESIDALSSFTHAASCPTCKTEIADPSELVQKFTQSRENYENELKEKEQEIVNARNEYESARILLGKIQQSESQLNNASYAVENATEALSKAQAVNNILKNEVDSLVPIDVESHHKKISEMEAQRNNIVMQGEKIKRAVEVQARIASMEENLKAETLKMETIAPSMHEISEKLVGLRPLDSLESEVRTLEARLEEARVRHNALFSEMKNFETQHGKLEERMVNARGAVDREKALADKKTLKIIALQQRAAVTDLLREYRKERVSKIAPELSLNATEMISEMTNGKYIEVIVADDFATSVIKDDGFEYSVTELSGGEKSVVALALRIAIGSLITGDNAGLLWLDEVLPAQDSERREAILGVLHSLPIQQIIMINHTHDAEDVVDHVIRVAYHEDGSIVS